MFYRKKAKIHGFARAKLRYRIDVKQIDSRDKRKKVNEIRCVKQYRIVFLDRVVQVEN